MKRIFFLCIYLLGAVFSASAHAGMQAGKVTELWVHASVVDVKLADPTGTRAGCAANDPYWQFDPSTPAGGRWLSILLTAQVTQQTIMIAGVDGCQINPNRETVQYIRITTP